EGVNIEASLKQVRALSLPPSLLLTVISAGDNSNFATQAEFQIHDKGQSALSQLIPNSKLIIVSKSGHFVQLDQPQVVIQAVYEMVNGLRRKSMFLRTPLRMS